MISNTPRTIMLVEDADDIRAMLKLHLEKDNYRVLAISNASEAVEVALRELPDLILMDIEMPEMDGISATHILRGYEQLQSIPIIALTAFDGEDYRADAGDAGCDGYLTKPVDFDELNKTIMLLISNRQGLTLSGGR
ncbi:MAG: response regulator [Pyrinomonadaceae bacterium]